MLVIKSARWGGSCTTGLRSRITRLLSSQGADSTSKTSGTFQGPYLPKDTTVNTNTFREIKKNIDEPTSKNPEDLDPDALSTPEARVMKRHLFLLKKYHNESSMRLVFEGFKDLPLHSPRNAAFLEEFLSCLRRIDTTDNSDSLFTLNDIHNFTAERGIATGARAESTRFLAELLMSRMATNTQIREYNRNFSRFIESLQSVFPELVVPCLQKALPALKVHQHSIMMTEQLRILFVASACADLDIGSQQYCLEVSQHLESCCELFDFTELHLVLECILNLDKAATRWTVYEDLRKSLLCIVANLEKRFTREILAPLHNPVAYSRSLALISQLGATDVKMQILKDKLENMMLPRYSMAKFIEENGPTLSNASRAQRTFLLILVSKGIKLHQFDSDQQSQSRARDNKRKTEADIKLFCNSLAKDAGIPYLVCPVKIMEVAKWKAFNTGSPVLLTETQVQTLDQIIDFNLRSFNSNPQTPSGPQHQARWLKDQLRSWKSSTKPGPPPQDMTKPDKTLSNLPTDPQKPLLDLSSLASLYAQSHQPQQTTPSTS